MGGKEMLEVEGRNYRVLWRGGSYGSHGMGRLADVATVQVGANEAAVWCDTSQFRRDWCFAHRRWRRGVAAAWLRGVLPDKGYPYLTEERLAKII